MNALRQLTIYQRLLVNALLMLIGIAVLCSSTLYYTYDAMLQSRRDATREQLDTAFSTLDHYRQLVAAGQLNVEQAQQQAIETLRHMSYGQGGSFSNSGHQWQGYFQGVCPDRSSSVGRRFCRLLLAKTGDV